MRFSHLKEREIKNDFQYMAGLLCDCGNDMKSAAHCLLYFANFITQRQTKKYISLIQKY